MNRDSLFSVPAMILASIVVLACLVFSQIVLLGTRAQMRDAQSVHDRRLEEATSFLPRVVFAVEGLLSRDPGGTESVEDAQRACRAVLGHASIPDFPPTTYLSNVIKDDPLLVVRRYDSAKGDYERRLAQLQLVYDNLVAADVTDTKWELVEEFEEQSRSMVSELLQFSHILNQVVSAIHSQIDRRVDQALSRLGIAMPVLLVTMCVAGTVAAMLMRRARGDVRLLSVRKGELEVIVRSRTSMLEDTNTRLQEEIESHRRSLEELIQSQTVLKEREEQLLQAQKLRAVGGLAGGVAHEFNNILTAVLGYAGIMSDDPELPPHLSNAAGSIVEGAKRAGALTRQLLAFSRRQVLQPRLVDVNRLLEDTESLLRGLVGSDLDLQITPASQAATIYVDPVQMQQVLFNLASNAKDAMPQGGALTIAVTRSDRPQKDLGFSIDEDDYVQISVCDNGTGMDEETSARVFEPFFTTKEVGQGTGLGLSTVYGIVKQSDGYLWVESRLGEGTCFTILLRYVPAAISEALDDTITITGEN